MSYCYIIAKKIKIAEHRRGSPSPTSPKARRHRELILSPLAAYHSQMAGRQQGNKDVHGYCNGCMDVDRAADMDRATDMAMDMTMDMDGYGNGKLAINMDTVVPRCLPLTDGW